MTSRYRAVRMVAAMVAGGLALAACSSAGSSSSSESAASASAASTSSPSSPSPSTAASSSSSASAKYFGLLPASLQQSKTLTMVNYIDPPIFMETTSGQFTGVQSDFIAALEPLLGVTIQQDEVSSFATILTSLQAGRYDLTWGGLADIPPQEKVTDIIPWTWTAPTFVSSASSHYSNVMQLCGLKLATLTGSSPIIAAISSVSSLCKAAGKAAPSTLLLGDRSEEELAVQSGRVDAFGDLPFGAAYVAKQQPGKWSYFTVTKSPFVVLQLGVGIESGNSQLAKAIYAAMQELWTDGTYAKIMSKWGLTSYEVSRPVLDPLGSGGGPASNGPVAAG
jgi:polar amino acid transport system substrate-binding protein